MKHIEDFMNNMKATHTPEQCEAMFNLLKVFPDIDILILSNPDQVLTYRDARVSPVVMLSIYNRNLKILEDLKSRLMPQVISMLAQSAAMQFINKNPDFIPEKAIKSVLDATVKNIYDTFENNSVIESVKNILDSLDSKALTFIEKACDSKGYLNYYTPTENEPGHPMHQYNKAAKTANTQFTVSPNKDDLSSSENESDSEPTEAEIQMFNQAAKA